MPGVIRRILAVAILLSGAGFARADEYDVTIVLKDEALLVVPFLKYERNGFVQWTEETLPAQGART